MFKGELFAWNGKGIAKKIDKAHQKAVNALANNQDRTKIVSGGADGMVHVWDASLKKLQTLTIDIKEPINSVCPKVQIK